MYDIEHSDGIHRFVAISLNFLYRLVMRNSQIQAATWWLYMTQTDCARECSLRAKNSASWSQRDLICRLRC